MGDLPNYLSVAALVLAAGSLAALVCQMRKTARRAQHRVAGQLRTTQDRFRQLVDGIHDYAIFMLDAQGRVSSWNPGAERITGYPEREILGQPFSRLFPVEEAASGLPGRILRQAAAQGRLEDQGWRIRKDGRAILVNGIITAFHDDQGVLEGFSKVARDITDQHARQTAMYSLAERLEGQVEAQVQALREGEARIQGFIRHAPAAIAFKGLDGRFLLINPKLEAMVGLPSGKILGRTLQELLPAESAAAFQELDQRVLRDQRGVQLEQQWTGPGGTPVDLLTTVFPLVDTLGQCWGLGVIATDITESKRADQALLQSQKLESLGLLAGGIAHDFNNLLGAMQGNVELALLEADLAHARPHLDSLRGLMAKATDLLRRMLTYTGRGQNSVSVLDLNALVHEMTVLLGRSISKKALVRLELHPEPLAVAADPAQLQQVVMNLVINASEALGEHSGVITIRTGCAAAAADPAMPGPCVALEVADTGAGMTAQIMARIFDPFFSTKFTGRGLGLAAIHGIVRSHSGVIRVQSEPGQGSTFKVLLPAAAEPIAVLPPELRPPRAAPAGLRIDGTVLVVDDEEAMRAVAAKALARLGLATVQARDGQDALHLFQRHRDRIRLVLLDLTMPILDGEETCRELRRQGAAVPVVLTSGFSEAEALKRFHDLELAGFLQKPFGVGALLELVGRILGEERR